MNIVLIWTCNLLCSQLEQENERVQLGGFPAEDVATDQGQCEGPCDDEEDSADAACFRPGRHQAFPA